MFSICGWFPIFPVYLPFSSEIFPEHWGSALSNTHRSGHRARALPGWKVEVCVVLGTPSGPQLMCQGLGAHLAVHGSEVPTFRIERLFRATWSCRKHLQKPRLSLLTQALWQLILRTLWSIALFCSHATALLSHKWCNWEHVVFFPPKKDNYQVMAHAWREHHPGFKPLSSTSPPKLSTEKLSVVP